MFKIKFKIKKSLLTKIVLAFFMLSINSYADNTDMNKNLIVIGTDNAPVKIKVFSSFTCPHCADFHINVVKELKKEYIEIGKVQIIHIDFPLDQAAFNASKLLHCLDKTKQILFIDTIYETQSTWANSSSLDDINNNLKKIVKNLGISDTQFDKCLIDQNISDKILNSRIEANEKYSINSTPTIIINEKKLEGSATLKNIKKKIEKII